MLRGLRILKCQIMSNNPFNSKLLKQLSLEDTTAFYYRIQDLDPIYSSLPFSIRILLEAAVRNCDEFNITSKSVENILQWHINSQRNIEIPFKPARVVLQDFTGVPCLVDLAAMRDAISKFGADPLKINPSIPVELVIDHSIQVDYNGRVDAAKLNAIMEMKRNKERFQFLKWGSKSFLNMLIVPPGSGIVHQINLEYLARVVFLENSLLYPDTVVGTDSHTTMINGLGVVGWGVGGIEAEAAMLGQSMTMVLPKVLGYKFTGSLREGCTSTDLVLTAVQQLRKHGVVGKFVEFFGDGISTLSLSDRATLANMAPEYGATIGYFPIDEETFRYMKITGRTSSHINRVMTYAKEALLFRTGTESITYSEIIELNLETVEPCVSGPKRPQDRVTLQGLKDDFDACLSARAGFKGFGIPPSERDKKISYKLSGEIPATLSHGSIVIAAVTSCTNTSNPFVLVAAGLLAKKAVEKGLSIQPGIKTSFSPGSHVVTEYLTNSGLQGFLDQLGFHTTGYGCMTCIGNSGDIPPEQAEVITNNELVAVSVLSGNRNFEARINPFTAANYLASPPLVIAFALAGRININYETEELGKGVYLRDIWPTSNEIIAIVEKYVTPDLFSAVYRNINAMNEAWNQLETNSGNLYAWDSSTYIHQPPYFENMPLEPPPIQNISNASILAIFGDSITTDHISPAGSIAPRSPAAKFLEQAGVKATDFNTYGSRRGNDLVMIRGTFANTRLSNKMVGEGQTGPYTIHYPSGEKMFIFDASVRYRNENIALVIFAGKDYGSGSSRDWAAKGPFLQGVRVVIAESFERIHRSNLVGMGIVPLQFREGENTSSLGLIGNESISVKFPENLRPFTEITVSLSTGKSFKSILRLDTEVELIYFKHGGILNYVIRQKLQQKD